MIKNIVLDLDGTLADTITDIQGALNSMLREYGLQSITREQTLSNINYGATELIRRSLPSEYRNDDAFIKEARLVYEKYYSRCYNDNTYAFPEWDITLKKLSDNGISLSVLSNKQDEFVKKIISKLFPSIKFKFVMGNSELFPAKPSPESFLYIMNELSASKDETALVGDSDIDMKTAKNAEVTAIGVSWGYRNRDILLENGANHIIESPSDIFKIITV